MDLFRFYCPRMDESVVELSASEAHHLFSVLRLGRGERVELFDGAGALAVAEITSANPHSVILQVEELQVVPKPFGQQIIIAVSIAKGERFDWLIGKCTEIGVDRICPVLFERTVKRPKNPRSAERWRNLAVSAAKQCRRLYLPRIDSPLRLSDVLATLKEDFPKARLLLGSLDAQSPVLVGQQFGCFDVVAFVGPEGGVTDDEGILLRDGGVKCVRLTDTVLRVETAAMAFATILAAQRDANYMGKGS